MWRRVNWSGMNKSVTVEFHLYGIQELNEENDMCIIAVDIEKIC